MNYSCVEFIVDISGFYVHLRTKNIEKFCFGHDRIISILFIHVFFFFFLFHETFPYQPRKDTIRGRNSWRQNALSKTRVSVSICFFLFLFELFDSPSPLVRILSFVYIHRTYQYLLFDILLALLVFKFVKKKKTSYFR